MSDLGESGGGTVEGDDPAPPFPGEDIRFKTCTVVHDSDRYLLPDPETGPVDEVGIDGDAALVIESGLRNGGTVDLASEQPAHTLAYLLLY